MNTLATIAKVKADLKQKKVIVKDVTDLCNDAFALFNLCKQKDEEIKRLKQSPEAYPPELYEARKKMVLELAQEKGVTEEQDARNSRPYPY